MLDRTKQTRKQIAVDFLTTIVSGDVRGAYERHAGEEFRHHNPYFASDAASLRKGMEEDEAANPGKKLEVQHALQDGDFVAVHSKLSRAGMVVAVVHLFRFDDDRIVELWDVAQVAPENIVNEHGMF